MVEKPAEVLARLRARRALVNDNARAVSAEIRGAVESQRVSPDGTVEVVKP